MEMTLFPRVIETIKEVDEWRAPNTVPGTLRAQKMPNPFDFLPSPKQDFFIYRLGEITDFRKTFLMSRLIQREGFSGSSELQALKVLK